MTQPHIAVPQSANVFMLVMIAVWPNGTCLPFVERHYGDPRSDNQHTDNQESITAIYSNVLIVLVGFNVSFYSLHFCGNDV
ncbi:hypothetical protein QCA50_007286 [Cerrena zonata]|uniref:Uncharacterized protein n=1 Tax=Cerrena zonata TaxID=2478898 RepID=A0AAW0GDQ6_9APHY